MAGSPDGLLPELHSEYLDFVLVIERDRLMLHSAVAC
jgi:hypothetical protein